MDANLLAAERQQVRGRQRVNGWRDRPGRPGRRARGLAPLGQQGAPLDDITRAVTELAELALDQACRLAFADLDRLKELNDVHGHQEGDLAIEAISRALRSRDRGCAPAEQFLDLYYDDLVADPLGVVRKVYSHFDLAFPEGLEERIGAFLRQHPKDRFGQHRYSLEQFGMNRDEVEAVVGHEISHVANGDMVTLTLVQGVVNTFVVFLSTIIGHFVDRIIFKTEEGHGPAYFIVSMVAQVLLSILATMIVMWFSRYREFRADAGGADLTSRAKMASALRALQRVHEPRDLPAGEFAAFGISGGIGDGIKRLFMSHPPLEERIAALEGRR